MGIHKAPRGGFSRPKAADLSTALDAGGIEIPVARACSAGRAGSAQDAASRPRHAHHPDLLPVLASDELPQDCPPPSGQTEPHARIGLLQRGELVCAIVFNSATGAFPCEMRWGTVTRGIYDHGRGARVISFGHRCRFRAP